MGKRNVTSGSIGRGSNRVSWRQITKRGQLVWILDYREAGKRRQCIAETELGDLCQTEAQAKKAANRQHEAFVRGLAIRQRQSEGGMTLREFVDSDQFTNYLRSQGLAASTIESHLSSYRALCASGIADLPLSAIGRAAIDAHVATRREQGRKPGTINIDLKFLGIALRVAEDYGVLTASPCIRRLPNPRPRHRLLTADQVSQLMAAVRMEPERWRWRYALVATWAYAGLRQQEGVRLERAWIDFVNHTIEVHATKTGRNEPVPLIYPLDQILSEHLATIPAEQERLFPDQSRTFVSEWFRRMVSRAGLSGVTPHLLRHSLGQRLADAGCPLDAIMRVLRHRSAEVSLGYQQVSDATARRYLQQVADVVSAGGNIIKFPPQGATG